MTEILWSHKFGDFCCSRTLDRVPNHNGPMHTHDFIEIYYFISGDCTYMIEGTAYKLKPHDIVFKRPLEAHMLIVNSSHAPYERMGISIPVDLFRTIDPDNTLFELLMSRPLGTDNRFTSAEFEHTLCDELMQTLAKNGGNMSKVEILSVLLFVCAEAARVLRNIRTSKRSSDLGARLIDYVNEHLFSDISLERVSSAFYLSQSQVNRIFKAHTGSSLWRYIGVKRLLTARERIRSGIPAATACYECGYNDYSSFYRAYLKHFGHPPQDDKKTAVE